MGRLRSSLLLVLALVGLLCLALGFVSGIFLYQQTVSQLRTGLEQAEKKQSEELKRQAAKIQDITEVNARLRENYAEIEREFQKARSELNSLRDQNIELKREILRLKR